MTKERERRTLERNLAALRRARPELAERLARPVDGDHVDPGPPARYLHHKAWMPLALDDLGPPPGLDAVRGDACVLGVGVGDLVEQAIARRPDARVLAWDRDPRLLQLALARADWSERIASGRLELALGSDLIAHDLARYDRVEHPLLARIYARAIRAAERGAPRPRAVLCLGGLLVDSLGDALERAGYSAWPLDVRRIALEEIEREMRALAPELVVAVNYVNGLAELAARHGARLLCWEIDPLTTPPRLAPGAAEAGARAGIFTWRLRDVERFRAAGFTRAEHLPIGADVALRRPLALDAAERARYGARVSYVGASLMRNVEAFRARFLERWARTGRSAAEGGALIAWVLDEQRRHLSRFVVPELLASRAPELVRADARAPEDEDEDPALLLGELSAAEKRLTYVANLGRLKIDVWGDPGWRGIERHGVRYRGPAGNGEELTRIYNATTVNVDVGRLYQSDIVTLRTFDVLACGGFALVEHSAELERLFDVGRELVSYRTLGDLVEKAAHYADHPDEAAQIAARGLAAVRERHTLEARLARMLASA